MASVTIKGVPKTIFNLKRVGMKIRIGLRKGTLEGAQLVQVEAQDRVPVLTGNLYESAYATRRAEFEKVAAATVGFTAHYAGPVHEDLEAHHENGMSKFLERALLDNTRAVVDILRIVANREMMK